MKFTPDDQASGEEYEHMANLSEELKTGLKLISFVEVNAPLSVNKYCRVVGSLHFVLLVALNAIPLSQRHRHNSEKVLPDTL